MSKSIKFYKLQGAGNDFVAIDNRDRLFSIEELIALTPKLCNRRFGIGADGLLALFPSESKHDYTMVYRNADGSDAGMCGNGGRCTARLAVHLGVPNLHQFDVHGHLYDAVVEPDAVSISLPAKPKVVAISDNDFFNLASIFTGTEHITTQVDAGTLQNDKYLRENGKFLRNDARFAPKGTNVNFYTPETENAIHLVTYERGVEDLTLACGTGALASAIAHHYFSGSKNTSNNIRVRCLGGDLTALFSYDSIQNTYHHLQLKGPAQIVFEGVCEV